ncbi:hypothetical protein V495_04335 [Pseudogymnoascus sp. VKM F-4514 (FW-929)]|nr:hypothetical protein V490_01735 [Pseudogymnoascus sp. VKM F-3557]KFY42807.1 hypothetical protein V495_04335 [Pseudogymnoascus sp. VKM F-4514 (FW-929)]
MLSFYGSIASTEIGRLPWVLGSGLTATLVCQSEGWGWSEGWRLFTMVMLMIEHNFECTLDDVAIGASASQQLTSVGVESTRASWGTGELRHFSPLTHATRGVDKDLSSRFEYISCTSPVRFDTTPPLVKNFRPSPPYSPIIIKP